jgi:hypothetical protein
LDLNQLSLPRLNARQAKAVAAGGGAIALVFGLGAGWLAREPMDAALARTPDRPAQAEILAPPARPAATTPARPARIANARYLPAPVIQPAPSLENDDAASLPDPPTEAGPRDSADDTPAPPPTPDS